MRLEEIDVNFAISDNVKRDDIVWYDVLDGHFDLYGLLSPCEATQAFHRIPREVAEATNPGVAKLFLDTAGGRARFVTDSPYVAILCELARPMELMSHMPLSGSQGFDLYRQQEGEWKFFRSFFPPFTPGITGYSGIQMLPTQKTAYMLNFPLYGTVKSLKIGLHRDACLEHGPKYRRELPVVFYGSSITQGGCASRPGNAYEAHLSHRFDFDYVNLGFSGSARAEESIVSYMKELDMSVFVCDYDHNAPDLAHLEATLKPLYLAIREKHPDIPYIFASSPGVRTGEARRQHVRKVYEEAVAAGDTNVYYVDGGHMFDGPYADGCTMEGCHPNDIGFFRMYEAFAREFARFMK